MKLLFLILTGLPFALADDWEDFTNNLATDLAPLITLFGEQLTKQFLSESINLLDNLIFALAPLGVLTAVVSVIRVCGSPSLKAFIGRAQEGPAEAESELLPCVSESTAELFNDGGISRVFGQPRILELVAWENKDPSTGRVSVEYGTLRSALKSGAWSLKDSSDPQKDLQDLLDGPELEIPNLSLNKGIKRRSQFWFYFVALAGITMQIGVLVYSAVTVFIFPKAFQVDGAPVPNYAFPLYIIGTAFLFMGIFHCAILVGRSCKTYTLVPKRPSKIYWLQPGDQKLGDQVFNAFLAVNKGNHDSMTYIKSRRACLHSRSIEVPSALVFTIIGFIFQFIGERGLHASVILAQLGTTLVMSVLRTCLRTQRMKEDQNEIAAYRKTTHYKQQELDSLAFHLERIEWFCPVSYQTRRDQIDKYKLDKTSPVHRVIQTRKRIAELTATTDHASAVPWDDIPIRITAHNLARVIERTMSIVSGWGIRFNRSFQFELGFDCNLRLPGSQTELSASYAIHIIRSGDGLSWIVDATELEAIIGLWTWSLYKHNDEWRKPLVRMVGCSVHDSANIETYLDFQKWILQEEDVESSPSKAIISERQGFGYCSQSRSSPSQILVINTNTELEDLVAQDIYKGFLNAVLCDVPKLDYSTDLIPGYSHGWTATHTQIDNLVKCWGDCLLGSNEDALLCIIPILRSKKLLPYLGSDQRNIRKRTADLIEKKDWATAFNMHRWLCQRTDGVEFERSIYEMGYLCRRALLQLDKTIQEEGLNQLSILLKEDTRISFLSSRKRPLFVQDIQTPDRQIWWREYSKQLMWMLDNISLNNPGTKWTHSKLMSLSPSGSSGPTSCLLSDDARTAETELQTATALLTWAKTNYHQRDNDGNYQAAILWAESSSQHAIAYWIVLRILEFPDQSLVPDLWSFAAMHELIWIFEILKNREADINSVGSMGEVALSNIIAQETQLPEAVRLLLSNGASPDGTEDSPNLRPLFIAVRQGYTEIVKILIAHQTNIEATDTRGESVFKMACENNHLDIVELLFLHGADINAFAIDSMTPLLHAINSRKDELVSRLLQYGCDVNSTGGQFQTPLYTAVEMGSDSIIVALLQRGCDVNQRSRGPYGEQTALELAMQTKNLEAIKFLGGDQPA